MSERFVLSCNWLNREGDTPFDEAFAAGIKITLGDTPLTLLLCELDAPEIRDDMRVCAWQLAEWFAANWWRLRWESFPRGGDGDVSRALSHCMASAGGGFIWPDIVFDSDGESIGISLSPDKDSPRSGPVKYLNEVDTHIPAGDFERAVDGFLTRVIDRGDLKRNAHDGSLKALWDEVLSERLNSEASLQRKWEAIAGYDPDEAPKQYLRWMVKVSDRFGLRASEEVTAQARHDSVETFKEIQQVAKRRGVTVSLPRFTRRLLRGTPNEQPWLKGARLARSVRNEWGLGTGPVSVERLADLLGTSCDKLFGNQVVKSPMPFLLRDEQGEQGGLFLSQNRITSRRFAVSRLIGDTLSTEDQGERLLPVTNTQTFRQKIQRAFAAEFLCPFDALWDKLAGSVSLDDIEDAANYFTVSSRVVEWQLVNNGQLDRDVLTQMVG